MTDYFKGVRLVGEVKSLYRKLAKQYHPDWGGDTATMQEVNAQYHAKLKGLHGQVSKGSDKKDHTYYYKAAAEQAVMDKIAELLALKLEKVEIELIGVWIWISGETKPVKDKLSAAGCQWHSKRKKWYWRKFTHRRKYRPNMSMDHLRMAYGSTRFDNESGESGLQPA